MMKFFRKAKLYDYSFFLLIGFVFFLPFNHHLNTYILGIFVLLTLTDKNFYIHYNFNGLNLKTKIIFFSLILLYLLFVLSLVHGGNINDGLNALTPRHSLLIMPPILFGLPYGKKKIRKLFLSFCMGVFISSVICIILVLYEKLQISKTEIWLDHNVYGDRSLGFFDSVIKRKSYFSYSRLSKFMHPSYLAIYICLSVAALYYYFRNDNFSKLQKTLIIFLIFYFIFYLILLTVRASFIALIFIALSIVIYELFLLKSRLPAIFLFLLISVLSIYIVKNIKFTNAVNDVFKIGTEGLDPDENYDTRIYIWRGSLSSIKKNIVFGVGIANSKNVLKETFSEQNFKEGEEIGFNSHNQFLDIWLETGLLGLITLIGIFIISVIYSVKRSNYLLLSFTGIVFINLLFESMLNRFAGVAFFVLFLSIILKDMNTAIPEEK